MTELKPPLSDAGAPAAAADPLEKLYKMSVTAGLGSGEYVAINGTAIAAICLGVASSLTLLGWVFLIVPVAAVLCGVFAVLQVRDSNGTQKGTGLAVVGIVLALGFGGYMLAESIGGYVGAREDRATIARMVGEWGDAVKSGKADELYGRFSEAFRRRVPRERFDSVMKSMRSNPTFGELQRVDSNNLVVFEVDPTTGRTVAMTTAKLKFDKMKEDEGFRTPVRLRKQDGGAAWEFDDAPELFPAPQQGGPGGPPGGPPGGAPGGPPAQ